VFYSSMYSCQKISMLSTISGTDELAEFLKTSL